LDASCLQVPPQKGRAMTAVIFLLSLNLLLIGSIAVRG
jgi:hypothetical protein